VCRSLDALAELVGDLAEAPGELEVPTFMQSHR
jgi:5-methylcytosine-specific restriction enzyme subunit McrC